MASDPWIFMENLPLVPLSLGDLHAMVEGTFFQDVRILPMVKSLECFPSIFSFFFQGEPHHFQRDNNLPSSGWNFWKTPWGGYQQHHEGVQGSVDALLWLCEATSEATGKT